MPQKKYFVYKEKISYIKHKEHKVVTLFVFVSFVFSKKVFLIYSCQHHDAFNAMYMNTQPKFKRISFEVTESIDYFIIFSI